METRTPPVAGLAVRPLWLPSWTLTLFGLTIFVGSALVFLVEPMVGKMALPLFGGAPAVWAVTLVFFQAVLLAGYAFSHVSIRALSVRRQSLAQLALLLAPLALLPIVVTRENPGTAAPALSRLGVLAVAVGIPFFVVSTASPVLQRWYSATGDRSSRDPYFLYAASNAGSLIGLLAYPALLEPHLTLAQQSRVWAFAYVAFALLTAVCALRLLAVESSSVVTAPATVSSAPARRRRLSWVALAAIPSSLMLGTTSYITTDLAAVPLLWVIPLALYLLSFVFAFASRQLLPMRTIGIAVVATSTLAVASILNLVLLPIWALVGVHALNLFLIALLVHRRLAIDRPPADRLTEFYLLISLGGVCGGIFNALVAPLVFNTILEYPIAIVLALLLRPGSRGPVPNARFFRKTSDVMSALAVAAAVLVVTLVLGAAGALTALTLHGTLALGLGAVVLFARRPVRFAAGIASLVLLTTLGQHQLVTQRTFFGVLQVIEANGNEHHFLHGVTLHGVESFAPGRRDEPLTYYNRQGPIGQVLDGIGAHARSVGVIGLGAGALAGYGRPGEEMTFYEINPGVVRIASDPRYFTFLHDSKAHVRVVIGDGRLTIADAPDRSYDVIVLDAFSSDAIPVHLLTREAVQLYLHKLRPGGLIAFHITNTYLDLAPVLGAVGRSLGLTGLVETYKPSPYLAGRGAAQSIWAVLAPNAETLAPLTKDPRWKSLDTTRRLRTWTDEYSNILSVANWLR
jgi:hypothetical protein